VKTAAFINSRTLTCALGSGLEEIRYAIETRNSGLSDTPWDDCDLKTWLGRVKTLDENPIQLDGRWESRNNRLAHLAIKKDNFMEVIEIAKDRYKPHRIGLVLGTSTSSIGRTEQGYRQLDDEGRFTPTYRQPDIHNPHAPGAFLMDFLELNGAALTISTACTSSAKALATAARWLEQDIVDAVVAGGVDSLCQSVIHGFNSLQLVDENKCRPFDADRGGINLGEAAGFALLTREPLVTGAIRLLGYGESSDAYHMSSAHPEGLGAEYAIKKALHRSSLQPADIGYVNLHGTGTRTNDDVEALVQQKLLPDSLCSSTKGWTGHTLGAAGICEAILTIDALTTGILPGTINTTTPEARIANNLLLENTKHKIQHAMSNSFGFGGNNCSLIFGAS
jgi:3-oxoacyl-[acyl-carrier-protein] synthase-1